MRSEGLALALVGCAFGTAPNPTTAEAVVANLLEDRLVEGATVLVAPGATSGVSTGQGAALLQGTTPDGAPLASLLVVDAGAPRLLDLPTFEGPATVTVGRAGDLVVLWACAGTGPRVWVWPEGAPEALDLDAPEGCATAFGRGPDGALTTAEFLVSGGGFDVRTWTIDLAGGALVQRSAVTLPSATADQPFRVGDDGDGPWVIGGTYGDVVWSGPDGVFVLPGFGLPSLVERDGADVRLATDDGNELYRWTPATGASVREDVSPVDANSMAPTRGFDGVLPLRLEPWATIGADWVTDAWWLTAGDGGFAVAELPPHPCHDDLEAADVGTWLPAAVLDAPEGRIGIWSVTSWMGPSAVIAAPF